MFMILLQQTPYLQLHQTPVFSFSIPQEVWRAPKPLMDTEPIVISRVGPSPTVDANLECIQTWNSVGSSGSEDPRAMNFLSL